MRSYCFLRNCKSFLKSGQIDFSYKVKWISDHWVCFEYLVQRQRSKSQAHHTPHVLQNKHTRVHCTLTVLVPLFPREKHLEYLFLITLYKPIMYYNFLASFPFLPLKIISFGYSQSVQQWLVLQAVCWEDQEQVVICLREQSDAFPTLLHKLLLILLLLPFLILLKLMFPKWVCIFYSCFSHKSFPILIYVKLYMFICTIGLAWDSLIMRRTHIISLFI